MTDSKASTLNWTSSEWDISPSYVPFPWQQSPVALQITIDTPHVNFRKVRFNGMLRADMFFWTSHPAVATPS